MLVAAAAERWKVPASSCRVEKGYVVAGDKRLSFGKLAAAAQKQTPPTQVALKDPKDWTIIGKPTKRLDSPEKVTGRAQFGLDVKVPGMLTAVVERSPVFGGKVKSFNADKAKAVRGVKGVFQVPSGVAVVADRFYAAKLGREALEVEWDLGPGAQIETAKLREEYRALANTPGTQAAAAGDLEAGFRSAAKTLEADYEFPYLAHATMEPQNCTVRIGDGECEIWTGTQFQTMDQMTAAKILGIPPEKVKIHTMFLGGGFGRRATPTSHVVAEAVSRREGGRRRPSRSCGRAKTTCAAATTARRTSTDCASASTSRARPSRGSRRSSASRSSPARRSSRCWSRTASTGLRSRARPTRRT